MFADWPSMQRPNLTGLLDPAAVAALRSGTRAAADAVAATLRTWAIVEVPGGSPDWVASGVTLRAGEAVTLLTVGKIWLAEALGVGYPAHFGVWHRIGSEGAAIKSASDTTTFTARADGPLMLVVKPPGEFLGVSGEFDPALPHVGGSGLFHTIVLVWQGSVKPALEQFAEHDVSGLAVHELARLEGPDPTPPGWRHHWRVGASSIYSSYTASDGAGIMCCRTETDAGILQYPVDVPLEEDTHLEWSWRVTKLPSTTAETSLPTHDYLSIAVEFDNGLDLTYYWSAELPVGTAFRCPLPWWDQHETHLVVRTGAADLGRWLDESQPIAADYRRAIGGALPQRIVAVWLIAVSVFQGGSGACDYAKIRLRGPQQTTPVSAGA